MAMSIRKCVTIKMFTSANEAGFNLGTFEASKWQNGILFYPQCLQNTSFVNNWAFLILGHGVCITGKGS